MSVAKAIVKSVPSRGVPIYSSECFYDGKKSNSLQFFTPILSLRFLSSLSSKHHGRGQRPKISQSEGESAGESGERRRWEHAEYVFFSFFSFSLISLFVEMISIRTFRIGNKTPLGLTFHSLSSFSTIITTEANEAAKSIQCKVCMQAFVSTLSHSELKKHAENKHPKLDAKQCFPFLE